MVSTRSGVGSIIIAVQSSVKPPLEVAVSIRNCIAALKEKISEMADETFNTLVLGVKNALTEKDKDIFTETFYYEEAVNTNYAFDKSKISIHLFNYFKHIYRKSKSLRS